MIIVIIMTTTTTQEVSDNKFWHQRIRLNGFYVLDLKNINNIDVSFIFIFLEMWKMKGQVIKHLYFEVLLLYFFID